MIKVGNKKYDYKEDLLIDMTPIIDAIFILLIFFILTANVAQHVYPVKLPKADSSFSHHLENNSPIKVTMFEDGTFAIGQQKYSSVNKVKEVLKSTNNKNDQKIIIIPDKNTKSGDLISFLTFLEGNNITNVDILIEDGK